MATPSMPQRGAHFLGADGNLHVIVEVLGQAASTLVAGLFVVRSQLGALFTVHQAAEHSLPQSPTEWVEVHVQQEHTLTPGERDAVAKGAES